MPLETAKLAGAVVFDKKINVRLLTEGGVLKSLNFGYVAKWFTMG